MAWQPTSRERDLELIVFGAILGNQSIAAATLEEVDSLAFYNSDVGMLADLVRDSLRDGKPLKENAVFVGWCKRHGIELNGGTVVSAIASAVKGNGRRRAADRALVMARHAKSIGLKDWCEQLQQTLATLTK
jgi:hypothetical protein